MHVLSLSDWYLRWLGAKDIDLCCFKMDEKGHVALNVIFYLKLSGCLFLFNPISSWFRISFLLFLCYPYTLFFYFCALNSLLVQVLLVLAFRCLSSPFFFTGKNPPSSHCALFFFLCSYSNELPFGINLLERN